MVRHSQTVNVVRWAPKGTNAVERRYTTANTAQATSWLLLETTAMSLPGLWIPSSRSQRSEKMEQKTRRHGGRSICAAPRGTRSTTSHGLQMGSTLSQAAWTTLPGSTMPRLVCRESCYYRQKLTSSGQLIRQIAEHQHYVQGVAWDPLNEYIATQSSDRSVHIYSLKTKDGSYTLDNRDEEPRKIGTTMKMDLPGRRISSNSPAPPDLGLRAQFAAEFDPIGSPGPSCPGTPTSLALPMNPPSTISHSRRSSFGAASPAMSMRRSASPAPSMPLPAVMPMEASPRPYSIGMGVKNAHIYANDTLKSFFRRLTFTPDGSLLFTPAGQYQSQFKGQEEHAKTMYEVTNTVYIYTRGGINKPPIAHLPGHKKPSVVVKCSPIYYAPRKVSPPTKHITIDTSSEDNMSALPDPISDLPMSPAHAVMEPPPLLPQTDPSGPTSSPKPKPLDVDTNSSAAPGPTMAFSLPYRIVYAVATEDAVLLYDTQQQTPLCVVSNLHCATFTDLTW